MSSKPAPQVDTTVLTTQEVADWLKVKKREVRRLGVPCLDFYGHPKSVRYLKSDVIAWLQQKRKAS